MFAALEIRSKRQKRNVLYAARNHTTMFDTTFHFSKSVFNQRPFLLHHNLLEFLTYLELHKKHESTIYTVAQYRFLRTLKTKAFHIFEDIFLIKICLALK